MAKKKAVMQLADRELTFGIDDRTAKIIAFNPNTMTLNINLYRNGVQVGSDGAFPFAHLPKELKKLIKPN